MTAVSLRLFVAIDLSPRIRSAITQLQAALMRTGVKSRLVAPENIHFTLKFLGETPESQLEAIKSTLEHVSVTPFVIHVQGVGCFPNPQRPRVIWVGIREGSTETGHLASAIDQALSRLGFPREQRPFTPHTTLARFKSPPSIGGPEAKALQEFLNIQKDFDGGMMPIASYHLKQSALTPQGPIYTTLHTITLSL